MKRPLVVRGDDGTFSLFGSAGPDGANGSGYYARLAADGTVLEPPTASRDRVLPAACAHGACVAVRYEGSARVVAQTLDARGMPMASNTLDTVPPLPPPQPCHDQLGSAGPVGCSLGRSMRGPVSVAGASAWGLALAAVLVARRRRRLGSGT